VGIEITNEDVSTGILSVIGIFPNPVMNILNISADTPSGSMEVSIFDRLGRKVDQFELDNLESGKCQLNWAVPINVPNGVYMLNVEHGRQTAGLRFTVARWR